MILVFTECLIILALWQVLNIKRKMQYYVIAVLNISHFLIASVI